MASQALKRLDFSDVTMARTLNSKAEVGGTLEEADVMGAPCKAFGAFVSPPATYPASSFMYLKLWDSIAPTIGTDAPDYQYRVPSAVDGYIPFNGSEGINFKNGLTFGCNHKAGTSCPSSTDSQVGVTLLLSEGVD
jgi:hypothetical protein